MVSIAFFIFGILIVGAALFAKADDVFVKAARYFGLDEKVINSLQQTRFGFKSRLFIGHLGLLAIMGGWLLRLLPIEPLSMVFAFFLYVILSFFLFVIFSWN